MCTLPNNKPSKVIIGQASSYWYLLKWTNPKKPTILLLCCSFVECLARKVLFTLPVFLPQCCHGEGKDADHHEARDGTPGQCLGSGRRTEARHVPHQQGEGYLEWEGLWEWWRLQSHLTKGENLVIQPKLSTNDCCITVVLSISLSR